MSLHYVSTRGNAPELAFADVLLEGLATDGGLYVPRTWPELPAPSPPGPTYAQTATEVMWPFVEGQIERAAFEQLTAEAYATFDHPDVAPIVPLDEDQGLWLMELFHGPTLAFKDVALQLVGRLFDHELARRGERVTIVGATSGDTGSAALEGCRHSAQVDICILHPHEKVSEVQRKQMTTVAGDNVFNLAVEGNFDDCQRLVKAAFADQSFLPSDRQLVAVNSINWARIVMQIVYYIHAGLRLGAPERAVSFSVPTGNFGDIYAGYLAREMGLPVKRLIVATNENDILHRFIGGNEYSVAPLKHTFSPSMDILVSSNFERYLFDLLGRDSKALAQFMACGAAGKASLSDARWRAMREVFDSASADDATTCATIAEVWRDHGVLLDPHTAVGVRAARATRESGGDPETPMICLATAHPAKFAEAVTAAGLPAPELPERLQHQFRRPERYRVVKNDLAEFTGILGGLAA